MTSDVVLAGAGLAAQRCAEALRAKGFDGPIRMVGREPWAPYDRPPLSKELLASRGPLAPPLLRPPSWYADHDVELLLGDPAAGLEPGTVRLRSGARLPFAHLLVATGADARRLPALDGHANVFTLRSLDDAAALRSHLAPGARLAVVGAGLVGLEVAATARSLGVEVTVVDVAPTPLARVVGAGLGAWFARLHRSRGVDLRCGTSIARVEAEAGAVRTVVLDDGTRLECDAVLVAIGAVPAVGWLAGARDVPGVHVAGDASGTHHWEAAARDGAGAARAMLGLPARAPATASVWSDQHGVRIHLIGKATAEPALVEEEDDHRLVAWFFAGGHRTGALVAGAPERVPEARRRLREHGPIATSPTERTAAC